MLSKFRYRSDKKEIMDEPGHASAVIRPVLKELDTINNLLGGYKASKNAFHHIGVMEGESIADWGCGGGDTIRKIDQWCYQQNLPVRLIGIDLSDEIILYAKEHLETNYHTEWICEDVMSEKISDNAFDIVHSCLFTHHFNDEEWVLLIKKMYSSASRAVIINDLHRHWFAYHSIKILTSFFSNSPMVKNDAPLSVLRSFKKKELIALLEKANIKYYRIKWIWAFRWQVILYKNPEK